MFSIRHIEYCARLPVGFTLSPPTESCAESEWFAASGGVWSELSARQKS